MQVLSDEMYRLLELNEGDRLPSACEFYDKAVSISGMSKIFGMAGVRIGWIITKDKGLYDKIAAFKDYTTICSSAPSEILSLIAIRSKDKIIDVQLKIMKSCKNAKTQLIFVTLDCLLTCRWPFGLKRPSSGFRLGGASST